MSVLSPELRERAEEIKARYPDTRSAMLPVLYLVQSVEGYVSRDGLKEVAEVLDLTTADVEAVATFYTMIRKRPAGKYILSVCTNLSCGLLGGKRLYERAHRILGPGCEGVTEDGLLTLHEEECLGACEQAPLVQVNFLNYARMTEEGLAELIEGLRREEPPPSTQGPRPPDLKATCRMLAGVGDGAGPAAARGGGASGG
jgi:NADH-quinone oxidoreductase subunit E